MHYVLRFDWKLLTGMLPIGLPLIPSSVFKSEEYVLKKETHRLFWWSCEAATISCDIILKYTLNVFVLSYETIWNQKQRILQTKKPV